MTITKNQARLIISHAEPSEDRVQITGTTFERLGIPLAALKSQPYYRGTELAPDDDVVHVMAREGLEKASGVKWVDYVNSQQDRQRVAVVGGI